jgi:hypothetical protein
MSSNLPVLALTVLGILIALLGLFAPAVELIIVGLVAIGAAGLLQVLGTRRS